MVSTPDRTVGVDIGCGMFAVRTQFSIDQVTADNADLVEVRHPATGRQRQSD